MCGRLNPKAQLRSLLLAGRERRVRRRAPRADEDRRAGVEIPHNVCPTDYADAVVGVSGEDLVAERLRFGLIPAWAKGSKAKVARRFGRTFNARCETVFDLASYREAILHRRCLVPVEGWHEWPERDQPYYIHRRDGAPVLLAGLWDRWISRDPADLAEGPTVSSMSVVTTPPGRYLGKFHDRGPLILDDEATLAWLDPATPPESLRRLLRPYDHPELEAYRVSAAVNRPRLKTGEVRRPIAPPVPQAGDEPLPAPASPAPETPLLSGFE